MTWVGWLLTAAGVVVGSLFYLAFYFQWEARQTRGIAYYGRSLEGRRALKRRMRWLSLPALPIVRLLAPSARRRPTMPSFEFEGVSGPTNVSSAEVFARAKQYEPRAEDIFVVTQMRCGTTWMQQVVYQVITRGQGDFHEPGREHLYAISPWIDAVNSVSMQDAALVGTPPRRIIKSHLPTVISPYNDRAKYIYVARHPVSCFASIVDFNRAMIGPLTPPVETLANWFCSDKMYWLPWPRHVDGWWRWSEVRGNVLFVHFEEMKRDFDSVRDRVAQFLGVELTSEEQKRVTERCSFDFMSEHEEYFEMAPPTMFSVAGGKFLASGKTSRHEDVTPDVQDRIRDYCRTALRDSTYPLQRFYPDVAAPRTGAPPSTGPETRA